MRVEPLNLRTFFLCQGLFLVEVAVGLIFGHQIFVASGRGDSAVFEKENFLRQFYGAEPVRDYYNRLVRDQGLERVLNLVFAFGVKGRGGLVEDQYVSVLEKGARQGNPLFLPA